MTETPEPKDQGQEQSEAPADPRPSSPPEAQAPQIEANQTPALPQEQAPAGEQALNPLSPSSDEVEDEDEQDGEKQVPAGPEQEEAARQKERLEEQGRWREDQQKRREQRAKERYTEFGKRNVSLKRLETETAYFQRVNDLFVQPEGLVVHTETPYRLLCKDRDEKTQQQTLRLKR